MVYSNLGMMIGGGETQYNLFSIADKLAHDSLHFTIFENEMIYDLNRRMDVFIKDSLLILPDTGVYHNLRETFIQSNVAKLNSVRNRLDAYTMDITLSAAMDSINNLLQTNAANLALLYSTLDEDSLGLPLSEEFTSSSQTLALQHSAYKAALENVWQQMEDDYNAHKQSIGAELDSIIASNVIENNELTLMKIKVDAHQVSGVHYSDHQKALISAIADLCPAEGGEPVFMARAMEAGFNPFKMYNDDINCATQVAQYRIAHQETILEKVDTKNSIHVYPNPTKETLNINIINDYEGNYSLRIVNLLGTTLYEDAEVKGLHELNLKKLSMKEGIYLLQMQNKSSFQTHQIRFVYAP